MQRTYRLGIVLALGLWAGSAEAELDLSKSIMPWKTQPGVSLADLIADGGTLVAVDNVRNSPREYVRYLFVQHGKRLYRCGEAIAIDGRDSMVSSVWCSVSIPPVKPISN
jgi:hypothetical protein